MELTQLKSSEIQSTREKILKKQNGKCALCGNTISDITGYSLDHQHMTKKEIIGEDGAGLVRGVLCRSCNVWEGKIWNNTQRYRQPKDVQDRIDMLHSLILYYRTESYEYINQNEKPQQPKVSKRNYNKLLKIYTGRKKFPPYPKTGKLTVALLALFEEYEIEPFNGS